MKILILFFLFISNDFIFSQHKYKVDYELSKKEEAFLDKVQYHSFQYFMHEVNKENGLVKDRSRIDAPSSTAATGFGVVSWIIGAERGWITRDKAFELVNTLVTFLLNSDQSGSVTSTGYKGFYFHFLDMKTGERVWDCELSTIDTGLLLAGLRFAYQYFNEDTEAEKKLRTMIDTITHRIDWDWLTIKEPKDKTNQYTISLGWYPERGFYEAGWRGFNEALIVYILAAGSGHTYAEKGYQSWLNTYKVGEPYPELKHVMYPPLFVHQYSHMFVDFRNMYDSFMKNLGIDYFENSRRATLTQRLYSMENPKNWVGYDSLTWGITACDGPGEEYNFNGNVFLGYAGRGTSGPDFTFFDDGTIAPTAAGGSIVFTPEYSIPALKNMYERFGQKGLWGKYGFKDAFNLTANWFGPEYIGIDQGPFVIMIENLRTGLVWEYLMRDPVIKKGLDRLGFKRTQ